MAAITVGSASKVFTNCNEHNVLVLREVALRVEEGAFVVLVGRSGCCETTSLRIRISTPDADTEQWLPTFPQLVKGWSSGKSLPVLGLGVEASDVASRPR